MAGEFELGHRVGTDAYGEIYVGTRDGERRVVTLLSDTILIDVLAEQRFASEVERISTVADAGVIPTTDFDFASSPRWIASSFAAGQLLSQRIASNGSIGPEGVRLLAVQVAKALQALHAYDVVQRDLSSDSVLLGPEGARLWHTGWAGLTDGSAYSATAHVQAIEWLSPEQVSGESATTASDIHAWAVMCLYAATGSNPFASGSASTTVQRLLRESPLIPPVFEPVLASLVAGALSKDPAARPTSRDLVMYLDPGAPLVEFTAAPQLDPPAPTDIAPQDEAEELPLAEELHPQVDLDEADSGDVAVDPDDDASAWEDEPDETAFFPVDYDDGRIKTPVVLILGVAVVVAGSGIGFAIAKLVLG